MVLEKQKKECISSVKPLPLQEKSVLHLIPKNKEVNPGGGRGKNPAEEPQHCYSSRTFSSSQRGQNEETIQRERWRMMEKIVEEGETRQQAVLQEHERHI